MKNVIRFLSLIALVAVTACNSSNAYKEQVNALDDTWKSTTENLNAVSQTAEKELESWKNMYEGMYGEDGSARKDISDEERQAVDSLDAICKGHGDKYRLINQEISELKELWVQNTRIVDDLNERLQNNTLSEEQAGAIDQLSDQAKEVNEQISTWNNEIEGVKKECEETCQQSAQGPDEA